MVMAIVKDDSIRSGKPVVQGSRVAVKDIVESFYDAGRSIEQIAYDFDLSTEEVEDALRYHDKDLRKVTA